MGWKGTLRSIQAGMRSAEKQNQRHLKHQAKTQQINDAATTVRTYEAYIQRITSIHTESIIQKIDWEAIANQSPPLEPTRLNHYESEAKYKYENFKPSFFDKIFKMSEKKKNTLQYSIAKSTTRDEEEYQKKLCVYHEEYIAWENNNKLAKQLLQKNAKAYIDAISKLNPFTKFEGLCSQVKFSINESCDLTAHVMVLDDEIIPKEKYSLRQSGTLSTKNMPKNEANTLYQNYVCSCVLRVAAELFSIVPIERVLINANDNILNPTTGYIEEQTILSIIIMKETLSDLNLKMLDPSSAMKNFIHHMQFKKTIGFHPVTPLIFTNMVDKKTLDVIT